MRKLIPILGLLALFIQFPNFAHEGHGTPGSKPGPLIPGGKIEEATHKGPHNHGVDVDELYFEAHIKDKKLSVYPRVMKPGQNTIEKLETNQISNVKLEVAYTHPKKVEKPVPQLQADVIEASLNPPTGARRIELLVSAVHLGEEKTAHIKDIKLKK